MNRILTTVALFAFFVTLPGVSLFAKTRDEKAEAKLRAKAEKIHLGVITLDTHSDISTSNFTDTVDYSQDLSTRGNIPKDAKRAGSISRG